MATIAELLDLAARYHQSGNLQQAEMLYGQILQIDPGHVTAHHLLGLIAHQAGRSDAAIALIRKAIALDPADVECRFNLGAVLMNQGRLAEAAECYREVVQRDPRHAQAHNNLGIILKKQGQLTEAVACYRHALQCNPDHAQAHNNLGNALKSQGLSVEAVECYRRALRCDPHNTHAHYNLGNALKDHGQMREAAQCYRQALAVNPRHAEAHNNLGVILKDQGQPTEAAESFRRALAINPDDANTHYNLGCVLKDLEQFAEAALCYRQVLRINPQHADALHGLSIVLTRAGLIEEALVHIEQALRNNPTQATALWQRSLLRLLMGDFAGGWQDFEQRWAQPNIAQRSLPRPRWDGSSLEGKTILVHAEQGHGDTIQFVRFLPMVKERGGTVLFECQTSLARLLAGVAGTDHVIPAGTPLPPYDVQVPLLSLPAIFGTTLAAVPAAVPYLRTDPNLVELWRQELAPVQGFKLGIAWQGSIDHPGDRHRSIPLTRFETLARVPGTRLVSVQKGPGTEQLKEYTGRISQLPSLTGAFPILDLGDRLETFLDTAAVLLNLDLVITVDSAVAHLAGALGVPVWVLLPFTSDWRWLRERSDSPWYPTMRLFRQRRFGDWEEVFAHVAANLAAKHEIGN
jgi:tetratricopeptide (TPR) repeat protein